MTFPYTVGEISTPLPSGPGTGSRMCRTRSRANLSKTSSWPRRGVTAKSSRPTSASKASAWSPQALTSRRVRSTPRRVTSRWYGSPGRTFSTRQFRCRSTPERTAWVAYARVVVHGQITDSPGTSSAASAPGPKCGSRAASSVAERSRVVPWPLRSAFSRRRGSVARCSSFQATSSAPSGSTGMPASRAYPSSSRCPSRTSRASRVPGAASKPVCRMAVLAFEVPSRRRPRPPRSAIRSGWRASVRAIAEPTTPAPTTTTSYAVASPVGSGPVRVTLTGPRRPHRRPSRPGPPPPSARPAPRPPRGSAP
ncbi:hypothetical protein STANM309S_03776 [Streptomyces tanashiensis]